jgi:pseudaminic acid synthase
MATMFTEGSRPFVIAEMSGNHNGSLERSLDIVDAAAKAGAHALKIQTYTADTMTIDVKGGLFSIDDKKSLWHGETLYSLYQKAHTPWEWHAPIFDRCKKHGMVGFSTPFDSTAVEFLEKLQVPFYKIASFENTDWPLLRTVAKTKKPIIMSTGMATKAELSESVEVLKKAGCEQLVLLKCTSSYPASPEHSNLRAIPTMRELYKCQVGLSDHTLGIGAAVASISFGVSVIEKHFTLSRHDGGVDAAFSLEPTEFKELVIETERAWLALGKSEFAPTQSEKGSLRYRRSIYVTRDLKAGDALSFDNVRIIRPGDGLAPKFFDEVLGKKVKRALSRGTPLRLEDLSS